MSEAASRRRKALRNFYKLQQQQQENQQENGSEFLDNDVESNGLNIPDDKIDEYVKQLIAKSDIKELLHTENEILSQIKGLDSEQKTLIYNNYDKLISTSAMLDSQMNNARQLTMMDQLSTNLIKVSELLKSVPKYSQSHQSDSQKALIIKELRWLFTADQEIRSLVNKNKASEAYHLASLAIELIDLWQPKLDSNELSTIRENCHKSIVEYNLEGEKVKAGEKI